MEDKQPEAMVNDQQSAHLEDAKPDGTNATVLAYDAKEASRIIRKVDYRLIPVLTVLYILSFMDRANIGNAKVAGMNEDLGLTGPQYNMALTVFFFPYALFEVPSNIVLKLMRPSRWMTVLVIAWGTVVTLQGLVQRYEHLIVTRVLLGTTEAGFFPAATYLLTTWYSRWQLQTRMAVFYSAAALAGGFSGLLAFGIQHMDGIAGLGGWRWIFILEGILTVCVGTSIPWLLPDSPMDASFLQPEEKQFIIAKMRQDVGVHTDSANAEKDKFEWRYVKEVLLDLKIYLAVLIYWGNSISTYGFNFASPTIIKELGYTAAQAQLLTIPVYFFGACSTIVFSRIADKRKTRWLFIVIPYCIALVGFAAILGTTKASLPGLTYFFLFFITGGLYPSIIGCISWAGNNLAPDFKRAIGMAFLMTVGNLGGAIGSNIFLQNEAPHYWLGYGFSLGTIVVAIVATIALRFLTQSINKKRDAIPEDEIRAQYTEEELLAMGDKSPLFRFVS